MTTFIRPVALFTTLLGSTVAFHPSLRGLPQSTTKSALQGSSYLDHLGPTTQVAPQPGAAIPSYLDAISTASNNAPPPATAGPTTAAPTTYLDNLAASGTPVAPAIVTPDAPQSDDSIIAASFPYAPLEYFNIANLAFKGPRETADWGTPEDASRPLAEDGALRAGAWWCAPGGWPSPNPKAHTEIFYVLSGHGSLGDADGVTHHFGPGDTVIIPKGHTGRWDIQESIHKVWAVNAHARVEETGPIIRTQVDGYHTFAPQNMVPNGGLDFLYRSSNPNIASNCFYNVGPTKVGVWTCPSPSSFPVTNGPRSFFFVLEGVVVVTDGISKDARRCVAGDTVMLREGWSGHIDVIEPCKKLWTTVD